MKAFVRLTGNCPDRDYVKGDTGVVDGYVNVEGRPYAVVILTKNNRFALALIHHLEFCSYGQTQGNTGGQI